MDVNARLCEAVKAENLLEVERLLALPGIDINNACNGVSVLYTAIYKAAAFRRVYNPVLVEIFNRLLQVPGIDVNKLNGPYTPLTMLTWQHIHFDDPPEKENIIQSMAIALINHPNIDLTKETAYGNQGNQALTRSAYNGHTEIARSLLHRPEIDIGTKSEALRLAVDNRHAELVALLLTVPDIHVHPNNLLTAAIGPGHTILQMLLAHPGINVNVTNDEGETPLMFVDLTGLELLLQHPDIDVNQVDNDGNSPILYKIKTIIRYRDNVVYHSSILKITRLLAHPDIDLNIQNLEGKTALMLAAEHGLLEVVRLLLDAGADLGIRNNEGKRAEHIATEKGHMDIARLIGQYYAANATRRRGHALTAFGLERERREKYNMGGNSNSNNEMPPLEYVPGNNQNGGRRRHRKTQRAQRKHRSRRCRR